MRSHPLLVVTGALATALVLGAAPAAARSRGDLGRGRHQPDPEWKAEVEATLACHAAENPWLAHVLEHWQRSATRGWRPHWAADTHPGRLHRHRPSPRPPLAWGLMRALAAHLGPCPAPEPPPEEEPAGTPLLDASGAVVAELGDLELGPDGDSVRIGSAFSDPVAIVGPPSAQDPEPGVVRVAGLAGDRLEARFDEWSYQDGVHAAETAAYLVAESGRHTLADGSVWEVGASDLGGEASWQTRSFAGAFPSPPRLFLTVQTRNEAQPVAVRARAVSEAGFEAALFEEEAAVDGHAFERVGYLAVWSPVRSGRLTSAEESFPYLAGRITADGQRVPVLSHALWLEEEASADAEVLHQDESVDVLAIGARLFAQETSSTGSDTVAVRLASPRVEAALEWGTLPEVDEQWQTVPLARRYENPIVVVRPMSSVGTEPAVVRVRNAGPDAFETRVQEWAYLDGLHQDERVFYLVAETGIQSIAGLVVEAASVETDLVLANGREPVSFAAPFPDVPAVFGSVMTENGPEPVVLRVDARSVTGFELALQEEEADTDGHAAETVGWIAVQRGRGVTEDGRLVKVFDAEADSLLRTVSFGEVLRGRFPVLVGQVASAIGRDPVELHYASLAPDAATLFLQEERSRDSETNHGLEDVSLLVAE